MPVDTSSYNTTPGPDMFSRASTLAGLQNTVQQHQNLQQQNKLLQAETASKNVSVNQQQLNLALDHVKIANNVLGSLYSKPDLNQGDIIGAIADARREGIIDTNTASTIMGRLPQDDNPQTNKDMIKPMLLRNLDMQSQLEASLPKPAQYNTGKQTLFGTIAPVLSQNPGEFSTQNAVQNQLTPSEKASRQQAVTPGGVPYSVPTGALVTDTGDPRNGGAMGGGSPVSAPPATPPAMSPAMQDTPNQGGGQINEEQIPTGGAVQVTPLAAPSAAPAPPIANAQGTNGLPPGALQTGLAPGEAETAQASAGQGIDLQKASDASQTRKGLLGQMEGLIKSGDFTSGPGADSWKKLVAGVQRPFGVQSEGVASQEEFSKLAGQIAQQQLGALGGNPTNDKLDSAVQTSPNTALSKLGNERIIALLKGNEDAIQTKNKEWQNWKKQNGSGTYGQFSTQFNEVFDPRVFQAQYMGAKERHKMLDGMSDKEYQKFQQSYKNAHQHGWIQ